jgi:hypothetical protein
MNLSTILAADGHQVRNDVKICIEPELNYMTCKIAKTWAAYKSKYPHTKSKHPGDFFMDFFPCKSQPGLTHRTSHGY